jgi:hypothetical protein
MLIILILFLLLLGGGGGYYGYTKYGYNGLGLVFFILLILFVLGYFGRGRFI